MKALKYYGCKNSAFLAASLATTLACLGIENATAQSDASGWPEVNIETCQALSDSTALDQESIKTRIACYSRDVEQLNTLVNQLTAERDELVSAAKEQSTSIDEYKQELANRQDAMQRLEERAAKLQVQVDEVATDRNLVREQLFNMIAEGKDQPVEVEANKILFENFSESYVSLTAEIEELRKRLLDFENTNTELSDQQLATQIENQQLQSEQQKLTTQITTLEDSVAGLQAENETLKTELTSANDSLEAIKNQLSTNAVIAQQQVSEIATLKSSLADSEKQRMDLETTIASLNEDHLQEITALNGQSDELNAKIDALNEQQLTLQEQASKSSEDAKGTIAARDKKITELATARKDLNAEREALIAQIASVEKSHLEQTQVYKDEAGELKEQIATLTTEKTDLGTQLEQQKSDNEQLKLVALESTDKNDALNLAANELREKLSAADAQASELQTSIDQLGQQSADDKAMFSEQVASLNSTIEQSQQDRDNLAAELNTVKPQLQDAEKSLMASEKQNNELTSSVVSLEQKLLAAAQKQGNLQAALLETENQSKAANENIATLEGSAETLTSLLAMSRAHSENADVALKELRAEITAADDRLNTKQKELEALLAEKTRIEDEFKAMASKARSQATAIQESLQSSGHDAVNVEVTEENTIGILLGSGQLFRTGSARLSSEGQQVLSDLATALELADDRRIMINGHSDNVPLGPKLAERFKDNWGLSMARALATATFFTEEAGITADRMTVSAFGDTQPIADNETEEGRQQNRRVEISLVPADSTIASAE